MSIGIRLDADRFLVGADMSTYDLVIRGGAVFDGSGAPPVMADVGVRVDRVAAIGAGLPEGSRTIDASGRWVIPGMLDVHTHYDAEVLASPGLGESVRHGVTTVILGNCSLSTVYCDAEDCADMFARVEALPRSIVCSTVKESKTWHDPASYVAAIEALPLGTNIAAFIGHSDMRVATMGLGRSVDANVRPTRAELDRMSRMLADALDAGFVGLSTIRSSWSKLEGTRYPARQLPSAYASWREYRALNAVLRQWGRVHQSTPNLTRRAEVALYLAQSIGGWWRTPLKTTLISAADVKADRTVARAVTAAATATNLLGGEFRWQHLPVPFEVYADGVDLVIFEEFGSGAAALNIRDEIQRNRLLADEAYRRQFRKDIAKRFGPRVWNRDLADAEIVSCPTAVSSENRSPPSPTNAGSHPPTRCWISPWNTEHNCGGAPRSPTTATRSSTAFNGHPPFRSASPTPAPTCATWRSTTSGSGCSNASTNGTSCPLRPPCIGSPGNSRTGTASTRGT
jgi:N-acyl-D-aspartate/D-glutamate deacylase